MSIYVPELADYYVKDPPYHFQQGDILQAVPIITSPASKELVILRRARTRAFEYPLTGGEVEPLRESIVTNAFDDDHPEFIMVTAQRVPAVLMSPTCDLEKRSVWLFSPLKSVPEAQRDDIFKGKALSLFPIYRVEEAGIGDSVVDVGDLRPVNKAAVSQDLRLKSMSVQACDALSEMIVRAQSRVWGYAEGELVPEDGVYRCRRDSGYYDLREEVKPITLKKGDKFPPCPNCNWSRKAAQWYQITKLLKRS